MAWYSAFLAAFRNYLGKQQSGELQSCQKSPHLETGVAQCDDSKVAKQQTRLWLSSRPAFENLPLNPDHPVASSWGLWGNSDELGTLNLLTEEVISKASEEIVTGQVIPLK